MKRRALVLLLVASLALLMFIIALEMENGEARPSKNEGEGCWEQGCHRGVVDEEDTIYVDLSKKSPYEKEEDRWTVKVRVEEIINGTARKTDRPIGGEIVWMAGTKYAVVLDQMDFDDDGDSFFELMVPRDNWTEGNYTIRAGFDRDGDRVFKNVTVFLPFETIPPVAEAYLVNLSSGERVKHLEMILRGGKAETRLDASTSRPVSDHMRYIWHITDDGYDVYVNTTERSFRYVFEKAGNYQLSLGVLDNRTGEISEDHVTVSVVEQNELPDLTVMQLSFAELDITQNESQTLTVKVANQGAAPADGFTISVFDDTGDGEAQLTTFSSSGLGPDESATFDFQWMVYDGPYDVSHYITVKIDPPRDGHPAGDVTEKDESNNNRTRTFDASYRLDDIHRLEFTYAALEPAAVNLSEKIDIIFALKNTGDVTEYNVKLLITTNGVLRMTYALNHLAANSTFDDIYTWPADMEGNISIRMWAYSDDAPQVTSDLDATVSGGEKPPGGGDDESFLKENGVGIAVGAAGTCILLAFVAGLSQTEIGRFSLFAAFAPLYTRIKREDTLNNAVRENIYNYIVSNPGENYLAIMKKLGVKNGTLVYHLSTLEREAFIKSRKDGKYKRFYPRGAKVAEAGHILSEFQKDILGTLSKHPGISQSKLADMLNKSRQSVNYQIKVLAKIGLVKVVKHGISSRCFPTET